MSHHTATLTAPFRNRTTKVKVDVVDGILKVPQRRMKAAEDRLGLGRWEPLHSDTSFMVVSADGRPVQYVDAKRSAECPRNLATRAAQAAQKEN